MEIVLNEIGLALLLGLVALVTFLVMNLFSNSLTPKSYDQALEELKAKEKRSPEKSPKKKSKKPKRGSIVADSDDEDQTETESSLKSKRKPSLTVNLRQHRIQRAESLKNEHVVFADEINPGDEKFSPHVVTEAVAGILQNKEEVPIVDPEGKEHLSNTFEEIQPLDDLQLIRRKSLQLTPTGSRSSSNRGSKTDLSNIGRDVDDDDEDDEEQEASSKEHQRVLKFADESVEPGVAPVASGDEEAPVADVKKICKSLKKVEMTAEEISIVIDLMLKKEEQSSWINKSKKYSILLQLKKEVEEKKSQLDEFLEQNNSLQTKLKQLRTEFMDEKTMLAKEKRELEEANASLNNQVNSIKAEEKVVRDRVQKLEEELVQLRGSSSTANTSSSDHSRLQDLEERLQAEREENARLNESIKEQQGVIKAALKRLDPSLEVDLCQEHQDSLEKFVEKMKRKRADDKD